MHLSFAFSDEKQHDTCTFTPVQHLSAITPKKHNTEAEIVFLSAEIKKGARAAFRWRGKKGWRQREGVFCTRSFVSVKYLGAPAFIFPSKENYKSSLFISNPFPVCYLYQEINGRFETRFIGQCSLQNVKWWRFLTRPDSSVFVKYFSYS